MEKRVALENFVWRHWCETVSVFVEEFPNEERLPDLQSLPHVMKFGMRSDDWPGLFSTACVSGRGGN